MKKYVRELKAINQQFETTPFKYKIPVVRLTFTEAIQLLKENDVQWPEQEDFSTAVEKQLGGLVKNKYDTDFFIFHTFPTFGRPFYTMPCQDDSNYSCSYDIFMRGEHIVSGAQRIHDSQLLKHTAKEIGIDLSNIKDYIDNFQYGAYPHGGGGIVLERVVMLYCELRNIRDCSLFPRGPQRITP